MTECRFEIFEPSLLDQVVDLRKRLWGRSHAANRAYLTWKYLQNPYLADPLIYVARSADQVVGMRGMFGTSWHMPGLDKAQVLPCAADSGIRSDHRDSGLFAALTDFALADLHDRGFRYVINLSATPANYVTSIMTMGWRKVGSYDPLIRSTKPSGGMPRGRPGPAAASTPTRLLQRLKDSQSVTTAVRGARSWLQRARGRNPFAELDKHRPRTGTDSVEITGSAQPDIMERIATQPDLPAAIRHVRDAKYVTWRYGNPHTSYRFLFPGGTDPHAYIVLQATAGNPGIQLVDWAGQPQGIVDLLNATISLAKPTELGTWGATVPAATRQHLSQAGFVPDRIRPMARRGGLIARALSNDQGDDWSIGTRNLLDLENWDLRMIFSDRF